MEKTEKEREENIMTQTVVRGKKTEVKNVLLTTASIGLMAGTLALSLIYGGDRTYYFVSLLLIVYMTIPFFVGFERKKPTVGEVVITAVFIALAVAGRAAFFFAPQVKPIGAIVVIAGLTLGPSGGFIVGAGSMFVSNFLFGQGPWTPWQMFAMGMVGLLAGLLSDKLLKGKKTIPVCIFGALVIFFVYGIIVDLWTIFGFTPEPNWETVVLVYGGALWFNMVFAVSTGIFLAFFTGPMVRKMERIRKKYGLWQR